MFGVKGDPRRPEESQEASSRLGRLKLAKRHPKGSTTEVLGRRKKGRGALDVRFTDVLQLAPHEQATHTHTRTPHSRFELGIFVDLLCFAPITW